MMWIYCFISFTIFLILMIIYLVPSQTEKKHFKTTSHNCVGYRYFDTSSFGSFLFHARRYAIK